MPTIYSAARAVLSALIATSGLYAATATASGDASGDRWALNGRFLATSNGQWARSNDVFHDEAVVRSTWTIETTCSTVSECTGTVTSDQGWQAEITTHNVEWVVKRDVPSWEPCADGTTVTGKQLYRFYPADPTGVADFNSTTYVGLDITTGPSGACGINLPLVISMPFKLIPLP
jgi:hypothetical protein